MKNNKFKEMRAKAKISFSSDEVSMGMANEAINLAEQWLDSSGYSYEYVTSKLEEKEKARCRSELRQYVKDGLWKAKKEEKFGFIGAFIGAVLFAVAVQLVARWIINNFFD